MGKMMIGLDIDDTFLDFKNPLISVCAAQGIPHSLKQWDGLEGVRDRYVALHCYIESTPRWIYNLDPFEGALDGLAKLRELGDVIAVTSPYYTSGRWMVERQEALRNRFGFHRDDIYMCSGKHRLPCQILIEDNPSTVFRHVERNVGTYGVLLRHPWTRKETAVLWERHPDLRQRIHFVDSWQEIVCTALDIHRNIPQRKW